MPLGTGDTLGVPIDGQAGERQGFWGEGLPRVVWGDGANDGDWVVSVTAQRLGTGHDTLGCLCLARHRLPLIAHPFAIPIALPTYASIIPFASSIQVAIHPLQKSRVA